MVLERFCPVISPSSKSHNIVGQEPCLDMPSRHVGHAQKVIVPQDNPSSVRLSWGRMFFAGATTVPPFHVCPMESRMKILPWGTILCCQQGQASFFFHSHSLTEAPSDPSPLVVSQRQCCCLCTTMSWTSNHTCRLSPRPPLSPAPRRLHSQATGSPCTTHHPFHNISQTLWAKRTQTQTQ